MAFSGFGVFDGHGGSKSATFCAKHLLENVMTYASRPPLDEQPPTPLPMGSQPGAEAQALLEEPTTEQLATWAAQDALVDRLPKACLAGFAATDRQFKAKHKESGTTATLALAVGWTLFIANVGDSVAVLDVGSHVVEVGVGCVSVYGQWQFLQQQEGGRVVIHAVVHAFMRLSVHSYTNARRCRATTAWTTTRQSSSASWPREGSWRLCTTRTRAM